MAATTSMPPPVPLGITASIPIARPQKTGIPARPDRPISWQSLAKRLFPTACWPGTSFAPSALPFSVSLFGSRPLKFLLRIADKLPFTQCAKHEFGFVSFRTPTVHMLALGSPLRRRERIPPTHPVTELRPLGK
jgi:hypothetical protein